MAEDLIQAEKDKKFIEFLEWASKEVATWPEWKRNCLGRIGDDEPERSPSSTGLEHQSDTLKVAGSNPAGITKAKHYDGYGWIKVKRLQDDESKTWEERFKMLAAHHEKETTFLIKEIRKLAEEYDKK